MEGIKISVHARGNADLLSTPTTLGLYNETLQWPRGRSRGGGREAHASNHLADMHRLAMLVKMPPSSLRNQTRESRRDVKNVSIATP